MGVGGFVFFGLLAAIRGGTGGGPFLGLAGATVGLGLLVAGCALLVVCGRGRLGRAGAAVAASGCVVVLPVGRSLGKPPANSPAPPPIGTDGICIAGVFPSLCPLLVLLSTH